MQVTVLATGPDGSIVLLDETPYQVQFILPLEKEFLFEMKSRVVHANTSAPTAYPKLFFAGEERAGYFIGRPGKSAGILVAERAEVLPVGIEDADAFIRTEPDIFFPILEDGIYLVLYCRARLLPGCRRRYWKLLVVKSYFNRPAWAVASHKMSWSSTRMSDTQQGSVR